MLLLDDRKIYFSNECFVNNKIYVMAQSSLFDFFMQDTYNECMHYVCVAWRFK